MLGFFERQRLAKKGLSPQKTRRRLTQSEVAETLEHGLITRIALVACAAAGLVWLITAGTTRMPTGPSIVALLIFSTAIGHLCLTRREIWTCNSRLLLLFLIVLSHLGLAKLCVIEADVAIHATGELLPGQFSNLQRHDMWLLAIPFGLGPVLASVLLGRSMAVFVSVFGTLLTLPVFASVSGDLDFIVRNVTTSLVCGFVAIYLTAEVRKRGDLPRAGLFVGLTTWLLAVAFREINLLHMWAEGAALNYQTLAFQSVVAVGAPVVMTLIIVGALPAVESLFRITTRVRWLELADLNHPLLRRMTIEAPGTFQHSLAVANLAEGACEAIGANPAMARVCSYFHDIGKLVKPEYFTENMRHDRNPHDDLADRKSVV